MFPWKRAKPRRVERLHGEGEAPWHAHLGDRRVLTQLGILAGLFAAALAIVQVPRAPLAVHKGMRLAHPILARVDFEYTDEKLTADVRDLASRRIGGVYKPELKGAEALRLGLRALVAKVSEAASLEDVPAAMRTEWHLDAALFAALKKPLGLEPEQMAAARAAVEKAMALLAQPMQLPILSTEDYEREVLRSKEMRDAIAKLPAGLSPEVLQPPQESEEAIRIETPAGDQTLPRLAIYQHPDSIQARIARLIGDPLEPLFGAKAVAALGAVMAKRIGPTLVLDQAETENRRADAAAAVKPIRVQRKAGTALVRAGVEVTDEDLRLLALEEEASREQLGWLGRLGEGLGGAAVIALVVGLLAAYTWRFQPQVARSPARSLILAILCLAVLGTSKAIAQTGGPVEFHAIVLTAAAMILTIAYSQVFAIGIIWMLVLLIAVATRNDFDWALTALAGTTAAILALREVNKRSRLIGIGALTGLALLVAVGGLYLWHLAYAETTAVQVLGSCLLYFASGLAAGFLVLGLLPFIERVFGIVTDISLLELCDVNQPALRRLAMEAPGTYAHSLLIGTLAEAAAKAIGAGSLLARVGAYFHDIGKINKPHYFAENAHDARAHDGLTPTMSRIIIQSHLKDGLEMADRMGLPPSIRRFIAEHHGTTVVEYFFREAERMQAESGGEAPVETDYRYPGPKPRSRETAIVMLADAVEGATRSLKEPTAVRLQATVEEMVMKRLLDGQLDESGLTLSEVHKIEEALTKTLASVYHNRIPYPSDRPAPEVPEAGARAEQHD